MNVVYADGSYEYLRNLVDNELVLLKLLSPYINVIQSGYPQVKKNSCGYRLDAVLNDKGFYPHKVFAGSEGTLGLVTSAKS